MSMASGPSQFIALTPKLYEYLVAHGHNGDPIRAELAAETAKLGQISTMQIAAEQGTFMAILAAAIGARSAVEVGTFTGYSALCVARALPAADTLKALSASHTFDFAFIDADKSSYPIYYDEILKRLRPGGLILIDNVLWKGAIVDEAIKDADTMELRALTDFIPKDPRVGAVMLAFSDGVTIVRKK